MEWTGMSSPSRIDALPDSGACSLKFITDPPSFAESTIFLSAVSSPFKAGGDARASDRCPEKYAACPPP